MKLAERPGPGLDYHLAECRAGDHEDCPGDRLEPVANGDLWRRRCFCGCHLLDPWPWPAEE